MRIDGVDLSQPIDRAQFATLYGVKIPHRDGNLHNAIPDYRSDEHRLIKRCQVLTDKVLDPAFVRENLALAM